MKMQGTFLLVLMACGSPEPAPRVQGGSSDVPQDGRRVIHLPEGGRMEGRLENGVRSGTWSSFYPDSSLRSRSEYVDGLEEGPTVVYHPNGRIMYTGSYLHGEPFGEWVYYGADGQEMKRVQHDSSGVVLR